MTDPGETINAMERLTREIERVTILRERYRAFGAKSVDLVSYGAQPVSFAPAIHLMTAALEAAHQAAASGDALTIIRILRELQGFES